MMNIAIEVEKGEAISLATGAKSMDIEVNLFEPKRFDGAQELAVLVFPMIESALPYISGIIIAQIAARRYFKVKVDGIEIQGINPENVAKISEDIRGNKKNG